MSKSRKLIVTAALIVLPVLGGAGTAAASSDHRDDHDRRDRHDRGCAITHFDRNGNFQRTEFRNHGSRFDGRICRSDDQWHFLDSGDIAPTPFVRH
ncbi:MULTISPECIES: hypothetical protein [Rhodococcus]|jgi:hypothetical protein|uniref:Secreted protein n=1 Tax=Rhodococcus aetherivorans TaxID=191292 RepID=A0AA46P382_9NOCA|nr:MULTISPECIES: hypothetical protein [Rhodococcus]NCL77883.1 hypothetical protein [Rhodococcus sp. YH1]ANZ26418.1 hypothetical protein A4U64_18330 [Rhodococcus sp. WB1]MBC2591419.1 hypothetical protein [Rhodococcus aetherivorans]OLL20973.1 hypothetical protein BKE56_014115 [Rhodococcus sp. M8]QPG44821.1 hypothetical protein ISO16_23710 [Rhodococcus sp. M8]